jgi:hypothetical protein
MRATGKEKVNGKLNYPDRYFLGLAPGQHPAKKLRHYVGTINSTFGCLMH